MINKIKELKNKKVLIIGDIILDHYINVVPSKISEEAPLLVFSYQKEYYSLGGAANVAKYLASFGCSIDLIGVVGVDDKSKITINLLKESKINTTGIIKNKDTITTCKTRLFSSDNKQVLRLDKEENKKDYSKLVIEKIKNIVFEYDLIIISDYNKGVISNDVLNITLKEAKKKNIKVICDPKNKGLKYQRLFLLKPNSKEMNMLIDNFYDEKIIKYKNNNKIDNIVLTLGEKGMKLFDKNNNIYEIDSYKNIVYDVTGAGDCVLSYLALGILTNMDLLKTCQLANYAASIKVSKFGTELVGIDEVIPFFNNKLISRDYLKEFCNVIHKNKKIVFTNGCFDVIHSGHIHTLKEAKKHGDILILGLNSDSSIKRLKGPNRPILSEQERVEILKSLEFIDYIVVFDEDTPLNIIKEIKPDILVKGADYKDKLIVGKKEVEKYGGKVVLINLIEGKSTTNIIKKIKEK